MLKFIKMHGLGNDFMVIDGVRQPFNLTREEMIALGNRHTGIGFDQLLVVEPSDALDIDFNYRIFNANGSEVGQCGNGARCLALFIQKQGLSDKKILKVKTKTSIMTLKIIRDDWVMVDMGHPLWQPKDIPIISKDESEYYSIPLEAGKEILVHALSVGNPHAIVPVLDVSKAEVLTLGKEICEHRLFPEQCNVSFMQILDKDNIALRVYERGCGETNACGSAAVATALAAMRFHDAHSSLTIHLTGGDLVVDWPNQQSVFLSGSASFVYSGEVFPCALSF